MAAAPRIVWAEDSDSDRYLIQEALDGTPFESSITFSDDGQAALRDIARTRPSGVVLDINMPRMDGITALRRIRQEHGDLPVVMFSTANLPDQVLECRELGVIAYAVKPVDYNSFRVVVHGIVSQFQEPAKAKAETPFIARLRP